MRPDTWSFLITAAVLWVSWGCNTPEDGPGGGQKSPPESLPRAGGPGGEDKATAGRKWNPEMKKAYTNARDRADELVRDWGVLTPAARSTVIKELRVAAETLAGEKKPDAKGAGREQVPDDIVTKSHYPTRKPGDRHGEEAPPPSVETLRAIGQKVLKKLDALRTDADAAEVKSDLAELRTVLDADRSVTPPGGPKDKPE